MRTKKLEPASANTVVYLAVPLPDGTWNVDPGGSIPGMCDRDELDFMHQHVTDASRAGFNARVRLCNGPPRSMTIYRDDHDPASGWVAIDSL